MRPSDEKLMGMDLRKPDIYNIIGEYFEPESDGDDELIDDCIDTESFEYMGVCVIV